jgi:hypothetical protein
MTHWVVVHRFELPQHLAVIRTRLESEGILYLLFDENTIQSYNFLSNAIGGVKLAVPRSDIEPTLQILRDAGYSPQPNEKGARFLEKISHLIRVIDVLSNPILTPLGFQKLEHRFAISLFVLAIIITVAIWTIGRLAS